MKLLFSPRFVVRSPVGAEAGWSARPLLSSARRHSRRSSAARSYLWTSLRDGIDVRYPGSPPTVHDRWALQLVTIEAAQRWGRYRSDGSLEEYAGPGWARSALAWSAGSRRKAGPVMLTRVPPHWWRQGFHGSGVFVATELGRDERRLLDADAQLAAPAGPEVLCPLVREVSMSRPTRSQHVPRSAWPGSRPPMLPPQKDPGSR